MTGEYLGVGPLYVGNENEPKDYDLFFEQLMCEVYFYKMRKITESLTPPSSETGKIHPAHQES